jgi:hypothetical protein
MGTATPVMVEIEETTMKSKVTGLRERAMWEAPRLQFKGTVGEILQSGGGKLSLVAQDPGENRCEKPHVDQCAK